jgi:hypothetical protein
MLGRDAIKPSYKGPYPTKEVTLKMLTLKKVREDLSEIRYYYSKQKVFDTAAKTVVQSSVLDKVTRYNQAVKDAPPKLFDLYLSLYVQNNSQSAVAYDWDFSIDYIKQLTKQLQEFLLFVLNG